LRGRDGTARDRHRQGDLQRGRNRRRTPSAHRHQQNSLSGALVARPVVRAPYSIL
jgi:hypothetical protein